MTIILNEADWDELCQQTPPPEPGDRVLDEFESLAGVPESIGQGYSRSMELLPGVWLEFYQ
jgi:hypothetical protein